MPHISLSQFADRFASLVMNGQGIPKKQLDRHILFISAILGLDSSRQYSEKELNEPLHAWTTRFGANVGLDHVTLRRLLVDEGYLNRDAAGSFYALKATDLPYTFDPGIESLDLGELIYAAKRAREERKLLHQRDVGQ
jgi:hypothetical protein